MVYIQAKRYSAASNILYAFHFFWFSVLDSLLHGMPYRLLIVSQLLMISNYYYVCFSSVGQALLFDKDNHISIFEHLGWWSRCLKLP